MRIAIVHDWLVNYAGAERVLEQMVKVFPEADLFSVVDFIPQGSRGFLQNKPVTTTFVQRLPLAKRHYRHYLPFMPLAVEKLDLSAYDLILSSSHAVAKGVLVGPDQTHIAYVYTPIRYAWDLQHQYLRESGLERGIKGWAALNMLHQVRIWDLRTANGVDHFIAISEYIARRIWRVYRRKATVIYPPVDVDAYTVAGTKDDFYLCASRMVPYKRMDLIVQAFSEMPDKKLVVIGDGPDLRKIKSKAGSNVEILGFQPFETLKDYMQRARAFVFAAEEDFGIVPLEAQACGTPVIAYGKGGVTETVRGLDAAEPTGVFFGEQTVASLREGIRRFEREENGFRPESCRKNAERFNPERFRREYMDFVKGHIGKGGDD